MMSTGRSLRPVRLAGRCLLVLAILGFALCSVTSPLIPDLAFMTGSFDNGVTLSVGSWGGCLYSSASNSTSCPSSQFGYFLSLDNFPGRTQEGDPPIDAKLTYAFVLFPLTGMIALLGLFINIVSSKRFIHRISVGVLFLSLLLGIAVTAMSLYIFIHAKNTINDQFADAPAMLGPALWVAVGSLAALVFGILLLVGGRGEKLHREQPPATETGLKISDPVLMSQDDRSTYYQHSISERPLVQQHYPQEYDHYEPQGHGHQYFEPEPEPEMTQYAQRQSQDYQHASYYPQDYPQEYPTSFEPVEQPVQEVRRSKHQHRSQSRTSSRSKH